jgi:SSS family solute:Na+ symporter
MLGAYTRWFNDWALLIGWAIGMLSGTAMAFATNLTPTFPLAVAGFTFPGYTALYTVILNLLVTVMLTALLNAVQPRRVPTDATVAADYHA